MKDEIRLEKDRKIKGIISIILSAAGFAGMAFFVKLSGDLPTMQKAMFRNCVAALIAFVMMRQQGLHYSVPKELRIPLLLRCCFGTLGILYVSEAGGCQYFTENGAFLCYCNVYFYFGRKAQ